MDEKEKINDNKFGEIIQRERKKRGKTLKEVADELLVNGESIITQSYLSRIENGNRANITINVLFALMDYFKLNPMEIFECFGYEHLLNVNTEIDELDMLIRVHNVKGLVPYENSIIKAVLESEQKERLIRIIQDTFNFGATKESNILYLLRKLIEDLEDYRKSIQ